MITAPINSLGWNASSPRWRKRSTHLGTILLLLSLLSIPRQASAQGAVETEQTIHGVVTDAATKEPLLGVTVSIPAQRIGAITNANGEYTIRHVPVGTHSVAAKIIGYQTTTKSIAVGAGENVTLDFALPVQAIQENEIVVTGLTGEVDRKKLGTRTTTVQGVQLQDAVVPSAIDGLSGRVPGAVVTKNSGVPGAGTYVTLRGRKTISGSSEPLYIVDGIIIDNSYINDTHAQSGAVQMANRATDINPDDIESIDVLQGASAAAMYGSLASNGVVIITTKHGKVGTTDHPATIELRSNAEFSEKVSAYPLQTQWGLVPGSNRSWGPALASNVTVYNQAEIPFQTATSSDENLTIAGGTPEFRYLASGTLNNLNGTVINSSLQDRDLHLNLQIAPLDHLDITTNTSYISRDNLLPQEGSNQSGILLGALRTPPNFNNGIIYNPDGTQHRFAGYDNPLWSEYNNHFESQNERILQSASAKWTPLEWLIVDGRLGYDHYNLTNDERLDPQSATTGRLGQVEHLISNNTSVNTDMTITANYSPFEELAATLLVGGQTIWNNNTTNDALAKQITPFFNQLSSGATQSGESTELHTKSVGVFAQLMLTARDNLTVTGAMRRDGVSTFGLDNRYHYYPKASISYEMSQESFMESIKGTLDRVHLRAAYGEAGSPSLPSAYATNFLYTTFGNNDGWERRTNAGRSGLIGLRQGQGNDNTLFQFGDPNVRPEITHELEMGFDLGFFKDRLTLSGTFYHANINDMILNVPTPGSSGFDITQRNAGAMWNEGFEWTVGGIPVMTDDFQWNSTINYARNYNLVTKLDIKPPGYPTTGDEFISIFGFVGMQNVAQIGKPLGVFQGIGYLRDASGNIMYSKTANDDQYFGSGLIGIPLVDPNPKIVGDPNPHFTLSWSNDFTILKNLMVGFLIDGVFGQQVWNGTKSALYAFGTHGDTKDRNSPWIENGKPVTDADGKPQTRQQYYQLYNTFIGFDENSVEDASYVKLREISIAYNWHGLAQWKIQTVRFTVAARNLHTWTKYTGFDPEVNTFANSEARGFDYFTLPQTRTYRFGITITY